MRIIAGSAKGHQLSTFEGDRIRPTSDRVRESLFSMLGNIEGATIVDGFAGSGALGLEALSRGATTGYFFDDSRQAIETVSDNAQRTGLTERSRIHQCTFERGLQEIVEGTPDLWFVDPPYHSGLARRALVAMSKATSVVTAGALVVWESDRREELFEVDHFEMTRQRVYGRTRLVFLRRSDE